MLRMALKDWSKKQMTKLTKPAESNLPRITSKDFGRRDLEIKAQRVGEIVTRSLREADEALRREQAAK